jgi:hypothetical protein
VLELGEIPEEAAEIGFAVLDQFESSPMRASAHRHWPPDRTQPVELGEQRLVRGDALRIRREDHRRLRRPRLESQRGATGKRCDEPRQNSGQGVERPVVPQ